MARRTVRLGAPPAEIHLPDSTGRLELSISEQGGRWPQIEIWGGPDLFLDDQPVQGRRHIGDAAVLSLGQPPGPVYRFRYENLQLRLLEKMRALWPS